MLRSFDRDQLRREFASAKPFPFVKIEELLQSDIAQEIAASYPSFDEALEQGMTFKTVNERKKVQITKAEMFPVQVQRSVLKFYIVCCMRSEPAFQLTICILNIRNGVWCWMTAECKSANHNSENIFLVGIPIHSKLQRMVCISEFKPALRIVIANDIIICIQEFAFKCLHISSRKSVWIIISKKVDFIFSPVKIYTVLSFRHQV